MPQAYLVRDDGSTESMTRVRCENEDRELQRLLQRNFDLLPGEQIDPDDPRRWLLVKREMPVPDPGTGGNRWSVDFLLMDQDAIPTFVDCKRYYAQRHVSAPTWLRRMSLEARPFGACRRGPARRPRRSSTAIR